MKRLTKQFQLTNEQQALMLELIYAVKDGGAVVAQIYDDGMIAAVLTPKETDVLHKILWSSDPENPIRNIKASSLAQRNRLVDEVKNA